ncbi:hypothetical protein SISSUDRAFT_922504 [Sistotremastrum suecicum HHB10207 ss-3]|uniref:Glucose receptor Git3 N-terminal domain-containing protein n=1 Tax=Sistotremastrum suecicum HHB10207 ss-3 TaxID=1314776 RepID=A0A166BUE3_9AGAM|nr:hypothetical protein SISSUDRAFT_922504 [Sistotremastrum suecicum HHB10207 ss-3]
MDSNSKSPAPVFTRAVCIGLWFSVAAAILSAVSVLGLLSYIFWQSVQNMSRRHLEDRRKRWCYHLQFFVVSLLFSDLLLSIGTGINAVWIHNKGVLEGPLCTTQAILRQTGQLGIALGTLAIAIITWGIIVKQWSTPPTHLSHFIVPGIWILSIILSPVQLAIPRQEPFFASTEYWCWISRSGGLQTAVAKYDLALTITRIDTDAPPGYRLQFSIWAGYGSPHSSK